ncbi:DNA polymerase kappa [Armadillidium vulgare]|nr:DNA polymerase kappa [Armadillidium vulgare]
MTSQHATSLIGYFACSNGELIPLTCTGTICFDQAQCGCLGTEESSSETKVTEPITVTSTAPSAPVTSVTCPAGCSLLDDPNDSCGSYFVCSGGELVPLTCIGTLCFDQAQCGCVDTGVTSSATTVTKPITVPSTSAPVTSVTLFYFVCSGTELIPITCTGTLCFDQAQCGCVDTEASSSATIVTQPITVPSTSAPVTTVTCPPGCPFLDDPNDSCGR